MSSPTIEESVRAIVADSGQLEVRSATISKDLLAQHPTDITGLIETLGFALTAPELPLRLAGTQLLSAVLGRLPADRLGAVQLQFIVTFYCDRLKDHHSVAPAVFVGLLAIAEQRAFPADAAARILQQLFAQISVQSQLRDDRQRVFRLLRLLSERHCDELLAMGSDLVYGCINAIDGERDPRILLHLFDEFVPAFVRDYPLGHLAEEMFEVCACYFPVDFHPAPDDPAAITRDRLAAALALCLTGHADFAPFCWPLLLEKLDSQLTVAKLDALHLLRMAGERFRAEDVEREFATVWTALHPEIVGAAAAGKSSAEVTAAALGALQALVRRASELEVGDGAHNCLVSVFESIMGSLSDVAAAQFDVSMLIAVACARASRPAALFVCGKVLPLLLAEAAAHAGDAVRTAAIYVHATHAVAACIGFEAAGELDAAVLAAYHERLLAGVRDANAGVRLTSVACLGRHVRALRADERSRTYAFVRELLAGAGPADVVSSANELLVALAQTHPAEVKRELLDRWLVAGAEGAELQPETAGPIVEAIAGLVGIEAFARPAVEFLLRNIFEPAAMSAIADIALDALDRVLRTCADALFAELHRSGDIVDQLVRFARRRGADGDGGGGSTETRRRVGRCLRTVVRRLDVDEQRALIERYVDGVDFRRAADAQIAVAVLAHASERIDVSAERFEGVVNGLFGVCLHEQDDGLRVEALQTLAAVANKWTTSEAHAQTLFRFVGELSLRPLDARRLWRPLAWIAKGLLVRGDEGGFSIFSMLFDTVHTEPDGPAKLAALDDITDAAAHADLHLPTVRFLHQQKLLQHVLKSLTESSSSAPPTGARLVAFAIVLRLMPLPALRSNVQRIVPLLFRGMELEDARAVEICIDVVDRLLAVQNETIAEHLNRVIPLYLQLCTFKGSLKIRVSALNGIHRIADSPAVTLQPYKQDVLFGLAAPLDDRKRLVRQAAVVARNKWFMV